MIVSNDNPFGSKRRDQKYLDKQPAWVDKSDAQVTIDIDSKSRTRKMKATEEETEVKGEEYTKRLQEFYNSKLQGQHSMFDWAHQEKEQPSDDDDQQEDSSIDPIANLLKSNTNVFEDKRQVLKQNVLEFKKIKNANVGHYHQ